MYFEKTETNLERFMKKNKNESNLFCFEFHVFYATVFHFKTKQMAHLKAMCFTRAHFDSSLFDTSIHVCLLLLGT